MERIGIIGIGLMGSALAERLLGAGFLVRGYDVDPARLEAFSRAGGVPAASPRDAACGADALLTCLMTGAIVREALLGEEGAAHALPPGCPVIDTTTCAPAESIALADDLRRLGLSLVDAPVSGSSAAARRGEVVVLAGGDPETVARCRPVFDAFARRVLHMGPNGAGSTAKLVTNLVLGLNRLALAEGLVLGKRTGLDPGLLLEALRESAAYSKVMDAKGERMLAGRFTEPEARLGQHLKDLDLILELGKSVGARLPVSELHRQLLLVALVKGWEGLDNAAIIQVLENL